MSGWVGGPIIFTLLLRSVVQRFQYTLYQSISIKNSGGSVSVSTRLLYILCRTTEHSVDMAIHIIYTYKDHSGCFVALQSATKRPHAATDYYNSGELQQSDINYVDSVVLQ